MKSLKKKPVHKREGKKTLCGFHIDWNVLNLTENEPEITCAKCIKILKTPPPLHLTGKCW
jgi:hypothetical protein